jgi:uncharacterized membrane protein
MEFIKKDTELLQKAIQAAELNTSGEIRLHIDRELKANLSVYERAQEVFEQLNMHQTAQRNGVLIYIAIQAKQFAIIGDAGIHEVVGNEFWDSISTQLSEYFKKGKFTEGLVIAIKQTGEKLKQYFPFQSDDKNELSDEISIGEDMHE